MTVKLLTVLKKAFLNNCSEVFAAKPTKWSADWRHWDTSSALDTHASITRCAPRHEVIFCMIQYITGKHVHTYISSSKLHIKARKCCSHQQSDLQRFWTSDLEWTARRCCFGADIFSTFRRQLNPYLF